MATDLSAELALALLAADAADAVSLPGFQSRAFTVMRKIDKSEVTELDRNTESAITALLRNERPAYSVYGEEHGVSGPTDASLQWVIDPIDGTSNFVRGVPVWATLIALVHDGVPVLGVVSAPALGSRWWATQGNGAFHNGQRIAVSDIATLERASVSVTVSESWHDAGKTEQLAALQRNAARVRNYGDFWQHMLVAQGAVDCAVDAIGLAPYDIAALTTIVSEAGGRWSDRHGNADWRANSLVCSNAHLHSVVIDHLRTS